MLIPFILLGLFLLTLNVTIFALFGIDKRLAEAGEWRINESTFQTLAFIGGTPGAYAGRHYFRHKTRKQPFSNQLHTTALIQIFVLVFLAVFGWENIWRVLVLILS